MGRVAGSKLQLGLGLSPCSVCRGRPGQRWEQPEARELVVEEMSISKHGSSGVGWGE